MAIDLNGIWRDGDYPVRVTQTGNTVVAKWLRVGYQCDPGDGKISAPTDDDFEATLSGDTLTGKTITCSTDGLTKADMTLKVVDNGDMLNGTWFNRTTGRNEPMTLIRCLRYLATVDKKTLEDWDNRRWSETLNQTDADKVSWYWPASFYLDLDNFKVSNEKWITESGNFTQVSSADMQLSDVVIFRGRSPSRPAIAHSAIATGIGDQVSQLWWTRAVRQSMHQDGKIINPPPDQPGPQNGGYAILRDGIQELVDDFTDDAGQKYFFDKYEVWRNKDRGPDTLRDLHDNICLDCPATHIVKAPVIRFIRP